MGCVSSTTQKQRLPNPANQAGQVSQVKPQNSAQTVQPVDNMGNKQQQINQQNVQPKIKDPLLPQKNQLSAPVQHHPYMPAELPYEVINQTSSPIKNDINHINGLQKKFANVELQKISENEVHQEQKVETQVKQLKDTSEEDKVHSEGPTSFRPPIHNNVNFNIQIN